MAYHAGFRPTILNWIDLAGTEQNRDLLQRLAFALNIEDLPVLQAYLRDTGRVTAGEGVVVTRLRGGVSNRTVLLTLPSGAAWVLKQALPKLRVAEDWFSDPARVHQEAAALRVLSALAPAETVPQLLFEDPEHHVLAIAAVPNPHENWKERLLRGLIDPASVEQFGQWLGQVHRQSAQDLDGLDPKLADRRFFESLRLEPYYAFAVTRHPDLKEFFEELMAETRATRLCLVHGDYSPKNVLIHAGRLIVLDYEVTHIGDPAFDLGFALTHLLSKAHHLVACRPVLLEAANLFWSKYRAEAPDLSDSPPLEARAVRHTLACLLARVDGRSPLEYLNAEEMARQRAVVRALIGNPPRRLPELIASFGGLLEAPRP